MVESALVALLEEFEEVEALLVGQAMGAPVVEDKELDAGELVDQSREPAIEAGGGHVVEETRHAGIGDGLVHARGLMGEGASQPGLSRAGLASEDDLLMGLEPATLGKREDLAAVEAAGGREVDVFHAGVGEAHLRIPEPVGEAFVGAMGRLAVEHQAEPFVAVESLTRVLFGEGAPCGGHAVQAETGHLIEGGVCQHYPSFLEVIGNRQGHGCCRDAGLAGWDPVRLCAARRSSRPNADAAGHPVPHGADGASWQNRICRVSAEIIQNPAGHARKIATFQR